MQEELKLDNRKISRLDDMRRQTWVNSLRLALESADAQCREAIYSAVGGETQWRKRNVERYLAGEISPSVARKGHPGAVSRLGVICPETELLWNHSFWTAADLSVRIDVNTADKLLQQLHPGVWHRFFCRLYPFMPGERLYRNWEFVDLRAWKLPCEDKALRLDCLIACLVLHRESMACGRDYLAHHSSHEAIRFMDSVRQDHRFACVADELYEFISRLVCGSRLRPDYFYVSPREVAIGVGQGGAEKPHVA